MLLHSLCSKLALFVSPENAPQNQVENEDQLKLLESLQVHMIDELERQRQNNKSMEESIDHQKLTLVEKEKEIA